MYLHAYTRILPQSDMRLQGTDASCVPRSQCSLCMTGCRAAQSTFPACSGVRCCVWLKAVDADYVRHSQMTGCQVAGSRAPCWTGQHVLWCFRQLPM